MVDNIENLRPGGSGILPEETHPKFLARHLSAYYFAKPFVIGKDVLEIGFGDGYGANFLADSARSIKAVDILEKNVALARNKYKKPNLEFRATDPSYSEFPENRFDAVMSFQVIEHIPESEIQAYLKSIKRLLRKDGKAFISTLNLDKNKKPNRPYPKNPFHIKEFTHKEFETTIKEVFKDYEIYGLFCTTKLKFYDRLKKLGILVKGYYANITPKDFVWRKTNLTECIDFMALCES